jgi:hypothetical protein
VEEVEVKVVAVVHVEKKMMILPMRGAVAGAVAAVHVEKKMMILPTRGAVAGVVAVAVEAELSLVGKKFHM